MLDPSIADHYRSGYERSRLFPGGRPTLEFVRSLELLGRLLPPPPARVLDVGGGPGTYAVPLAEGGYQVHQVYPGWGIGNVFTGNRAQVNGPGYGIYVQSKRLQTVVSCDNAVTAAGNGFSTLPCSSA